MKNINPTQTAAWQALQKHFDEMKDVTIADLFAKDGDRNVFHFIEVFL